jgi:hypothetical protein
MGTRFRERGFSSGGKIVGSDGFSQNDIIWEVDFRRFPLSDGTNAGYHTSLLSSKGLTLARASAATVQTSTSTVVTTGIGVDAPRIGDAGYGRGLVIEEARTNALTYCNDFSQSFWTAIGSGGGSTRALSGIAPDGGGAFRLTNGAPLIEGNARMHGNGTFGAGRFSVFTKSVVGSSVSLRYGGPTSYNTASNPTTWNRIIAVETAGVSNYPVVYGANFDNAGALLSGAAGDQSEWWGAQVELGAKFPTELILTTGATATRAEDSLIAPTSIVRNGRLGLAVKFIAKCGAAEFGGTHTLWSGHGASITDSIVFSHITRQAVVRVGGAVLFSSAAWSFNRGDTVEIWSEIGGGSLPSVIKYRVNGGAVVTLYNGAPAPALTPVTCGLMSAGSMNFSCWLQYARAYVPGRRPVWAA